ncbi:hypothetical protein B0H14DRAFT_1893 [Mycena olivaceomarginata]|nr:hypothetical protein B0H14DRAFT_1893 [Mycena olivaceomarginata]
MGTCFCNALLSTSTISCSRTIPNAFCQNPVRPTQQFDILATSQFFGTTRIVMLRLKCQATKLSVQFGMFAHRFGPVKHFKAYLEVPGSDAPRSLNLRSELQSSGVSLTDCPHNGRKNVADQMIMGAWCPR